MWLLINVLTCMFSALRHNALFAVCPGHSSLLSLSVVTGWPEQSQSLCVPKPLALVPPPCARAPSPLNTPQFILTSIKTFQNPLCWRCRRPVTPDSSLLWVWVAICQPRPRWRDGDRFLGGALGLSWPGHQQLPALTKSSETPGSRG